VIEQASGSARSDGRGGLRAGPASLEGLVWLARVGPASVEAWACAMGWRRSAAFSHAQRLERDGWVVRYPMLRGQGSLLVAGSLGARMAGVAISPARPPTPTWWAHLRARGWVAAWLTVRGRVMQGCREVEADPSWRGDLRWHDSKGAHRSGHRPDAPQTCLDLGAGAADVQASGCRSLDETQAPPAENAAASVGRRRPVVPTGAARRRVVGRPPGSAWQRRRSVSRCGLGAGRAWA
jgi:hypothetical protein